MAEESGLKLALSETPKTGFLVTRPIFLCTFIILLNLFSSLSDASSFSGPAGPGSGISGISTSDGVFSSSYNYI